MEDNLETWVTMFLTMIGTLGASSGFWAFLIHKDKRRTQTNQLLKGLAYDKIISMGMEYIERGWITRDEYEDYRELLYLPYKALGGNGITERIAAEVSNLPIRSRAKFNEVVLQGAKSRSSNDIPSPDPEDLAE